MVMFVSIPLAAERLGLSRASMYRLAATGAVRSCRFGSRVMIRQDWLDEYVEKSIQEGKEERRQKMEQQRQSTSGGDAMHEG